MLECVISRKLQSSFIEKPYFSMMFSYKFAIYYHSTYGGLLLTLLSSHRCHHIRYKNQLETLSYDAQFNIQNVFRIVAKFHFDY